MKTERISVAGGTITTTTGAPGSAAISSDGLRDGTLSWNSIIDGVEALTLALVANGHSLESLKGPIETALESAANNRSYSPE